MYDHFSKVAPSYRDIRTTDIEPISVISGALRGLDEIRVADIGCGGGRYDLLLFQHVENLHLTCVDINESMLEQASDYLRSNQVTNFKTVQARAETFPLEDGSMDGLITFNAIHHSDFVRFVERAAQTVNPDSGRIFIYTRSTTQNSRNIWGEYFPGFAEQETRLHEIEEMEEMIQSADGVRLDTAISFKYGRMASLDELVEKALARHYSTFSLYDEDELDTAIEVFQRNIEDAFDDTDRIEWFDENVLLTLSPDPY
jgi:2-polyprenyl-3-methyl-5-hydroxy-6-metoxy-1,4-benzoquinol methylase